MTQPHLPKIHRRPQHDTNRTNTTGGCPLHQTRQSPTIAKEKKPYLLCEEQTRDAPTKVKKIAFANPWAKVMPDVPTTNVERHLIAHTTQGQAPSKLSNTRSRRSDLPLLRRALLMVRSRHPVGNPKRKVRGAQQQVSLSCETNV
jgi:hypothetical protein